MNSKTIANGILRAVAILGIPLGALALAVPVHLALGPLAVPLNLKPEIEQGYYQILQDFVLIQLG